MFEFVSNESLKNDISVVILNIILIDESLSQIEGIPYDDQMLWEVESDSFISLICELNHLIVHLRIILPTEFKPLKILTRLPTMKLLMYVETTDVWFSFVIKKSKNYFASTVLWPFPILIDRYIIYDPSMFIEVKSLMNLSYKSFCIFFFLRSVNELDVQSYH